MIKLIMSDMDGTLLDTKGNVPAGFDNIIKELSKRNVIFAPASGRQYFSLLDSFKGYEDKFLFLAENGTMVRYQGKELFSSPMQHDIALKVINTVLDIPQVYSVYCGKKNAYVLKSQYDDAFAAELAKYYTHSAVVDDFSAIDDEIIKASFWDITGNADKSILVPLHKYADKLQVALSSAYWVDVMNADINKGIAIKQVQKKLKIKPEECAAFGDYLNDSEMMEAVYYSFAMANAHPKIKELARFSTASNEEHGVLRAIKKLIDDGLCGSAYE